MPTQVRCSKCQKAFVAKDSLAGKKVKCPNCKQNIIQIPALESAASKKQTTPKAKPQWRVKMPDGKIYGPIPQSQLTAWVADGRLTANCQIATAESNQWRPASQYFPQLNVAAPLDAIGFDIGSDETEPASATAVPALAPAAFQPVAGAPSPQQSTQRGIIWIVAGIMLAILGGSGFGCCCGCRISGIYWVTLIQLFTSVAAFAGAITCAVLAGRFLASIPNGAGYKNAKVVNTIGLVVCIIASLSGLVGTCGMGMQTIVETTGQGMYYYQQNRSSPTRFPSNDPFRNR